MAYGFGKDRKRNVRKEVRPEVKVVQEEHLADEESLVDAAEAAVGEDEDEMMIRRMIEEANAILGESVDMYDGTESGDGQAFLDDMENEDRNNPEDDLYDDGENERCDADPENTESEEADQEGHMGQDNVFPENDSRQPVEQDNDYLEELARLSAELGHASMQEKEPEDEILEAETEEIVPASEGLPEKEQEERLPDTDGAGNQDEAELSEDSREEHPLSGIQMPVQEEEQEIKKLFAIPEKPEEKLENTNQKEETGVSVILPGIIIEGNITAPTALDIRGEIKGNVNCKDKLNISGKITGDVQGTTIKMEKSKVKGDVICAKELVVNAGSAVAGNIKTSSVVIAGVIKGDVEASESADIAETAVIVGNVTSASIQIARGAVLEGTCSQNFNVGNLDEYFED